MTSISLENVTAGYSAGTTALNDVSLDFVSGSLTVVIGPSGCGKTTLLRTIAGLKKVDIGKVRFDDKVMNGIAPRFRNLAMVFQSDALYSHLSVRKNLAYATQAKNHGGEIERTSDPNGLSSTGIQDAAKRLGIDGLLHRKPFQLSGGERQRVALGRTLVRDPAAFLLDEPFSGIDAALKDQLRNYVKERQRENETTMILVTHHQEDAMLLADSIVVMNEGRVRQVGSPDEIYDHPEDVFVASFFGRPGINLLSGELLPELLELSESEEELKDKQSHELTIGIRPESFSLVENDSANECVNWKAKVTSSRRVGANQQLELRLSENETSVTAILDRSASHRTNRQTREVSVGGEITIAVATDEIHFFDTNSGRNIRQRKNNKS